MKPRVTLIYDRECPNVSATRAVLREALERAGMTSHWDEHGRATSCGDGPFAGYGSPTVLVDGVDVAGEAGGNAGASCRVYKAAGRLRGVPPVESIIEAVMRALGGRKGS